jgi:hypothetical protein
MTIYSGTASTAVDVLSLAVAGRAIVSVAAARQTQVIDMLLEATDCGVVVDSGRRRLVHDNVPVRRGDRKTQDRIQASLQRWLSRNGSDGPRGTALPMGFADVARAMGFDPMRMAALLEPLHQVRVSREGRVLALNRSGPIASGTYLNGRLAWRDGLVTVPGKDLPVMIRRALVGDVLGRLVDDHVLRGRRIRHVCAVDPREGMQRIVTMDAGRHLILQG